MCFLVTVYQGRCFSLIIFNDVLFFFGFWFFAAICKLNVFSFRFLGLLYIIFFRDLWNFTEFICRRVIKEKIYKLSTGNNKSSMDLITLYFYLLGPLRGPVQKKGTPRTGASFLWDFVDDFGIPYRAYLDHCQDLFEVIRTGCDFSTLTGCIYTLEESKSGSIGTKDRLLMFNKTTLFR